MRFEKSGMIVRVAAVAGALVLSTVLTLRGARAQSYVMKVTTPTINDAPHLLAKNFAAAVERDSGGRIKSEVYPASQLGAIPRQIEGVQFGAIRGHGRSRHGRFA
jgi:TRAP-type C4-dicarboxylate transport system substrate-binding protein